jgi:hypothetical protein
LVRDKQFAGEVEEPSRWERLAIACGIGYGAIFFAGLAFLTFFVVPKFAPIDAPPEQHAAAWAEMGNLSAVASYLLTLQIPFLLLFLGGLYAVLRRAEGGSGALAVSAFGAGVAMAMIWPMGLLVAEIGTGVAVAGGDVVTAVEFDAMAPFSLALSAFPRAVLLFATSLVLLGSGLVGRWVCWLGFALALVSLLGTGMLVDGLVPFPISLLGTMLFVVWVLALSISLFRSAPKAESAR